MSHYVNIDALVRVGYQSLAFASLLALVYGLGVVGMSRSGAAEGGQRATLPLIGALVAFALFLGAIALGIAVMASK